MAELAHYLDDRLATVGCMVIRTDIPSGFDPKGGHRLVHKRTLGCWIDQRQIKPGCRPRPPQQPLAATGASKSPADLVSIHQPVLVMNGERDKMTPTEHTVDLDRRLPDRQLVLIPTLDTARVPVPRGFRQVRLSSSG